MVEIHATYDRARIEKLRGMFGGDPRQGNATLYIREHFDLKRICENCGRRSDPKYRLAVASVIAEGDTWVLPFSIRSDGKILIDLEESIPDQSNFLSSNVTDALAEIGIACDGSGRVEYVIPIANDRDSYYRGLRRNKYSSYQKVQKAFDCHVVTDATPDDVLMWDTDVEYDFEAYWDERSRPGTCGFNVEVEYFQWLAQHGRLIVARISDEAGVTLGLCYCVPGDYDLFAVIIKRSIAQQYRKFGFGNALIFMLLDHIHERALLTPLNVGTVVQPYKDIWRPIPAIAKPQLYFDSPEAERLLRERFPMNEGVVT